MKEAERIPTDNELVVAWRAGDEVAGQALFERHYDAVHRFFRNKVPEPSELVQRTFLACLETADRFSEGRDFRRYLLGIARNVLYTHYRRVNGPRNHAPLDATSVEDMDQNPAQLIEEREEERLMLAGLRRLPVELQLALELQYWEKMTAREISEVLGVPVGTAKDRLRRAKLRLEQEIRALATSPKKLESTLTLLDDWAAGLRQLLGHRASA